MEKCALHRHRALDQLDRDRVMGRYLAVLLPKVHSPGAAWAMAHNCWVVFCALEHRGLAQPESLLEQLDLEEIAQLAEEYRLRFGPESTTEGGVNESYDRQVRGEDAHDAGAVDTPA